MPRVTIRIPRSLLRGVNREADTGHWHNRSAFIRSVLREAVEDRQRSRIATEMWEGET